MFDERVHRISVQVGSAPGPYSLSAGAMLDYHNAHDDSHMLPVKEQLANAKDRIRQRFKLGKFMASLHSLPTAPVSMEAIGSAVDEIMRDNEIIGLSITIRPDCITDEMRRFLKKTSKGFYTWLEPGLLTTHDATLARLGFSHTYEQALEAILPLFYSKIHIASHVVFGLPGETPAMMRQTMAEIARLNMGGVNIHNLYVVKNSPMEKDHQAGSLKTLERAEYVGLVCDFIELLPPSVVLHGIVDSVAEDRLVAPQWMVLRKENLDAITTELEKRGTKQGTKYDELRVMEYALASPAVEPAKPAQPEAEGAEQGLPEMFPTQ